MKRFFSYLSYIFGVLVIASLVLILSNKEKIKTHAVALISEQIEAKTGWKIQIEDLQFFFPHVITIKKVSLDPFVELNEVTFSFKIFDLLTERCVLNYLRIDSCVIKDLPSKNHLSGSEPQKRSFGLKINDFHINSVHFKDYAAFKLRGDLSFIPDLQQLTSNLSISRKNYSPVKVALTLSPTARHVSLSAEPHSLLTQFVPLNESYAFHVTADKDRFYLTYDLKDASPHPLLGEGGSITAKGTIASNKIDFSHFEGTVGPFFLEGNGFFDEIAKIHLTVSCPKFRNFTGLAAKCSVMGTLDQFEASVELHADSAAHQKLFFKDINIISSLHFDKHNLFGFWKWHNPDFELSSHFTSDLKTIALQDLNFHGFSMDLKGDLDIDLPSRLLRGFLEAKSGVTDYFDEAFARLHFYGTEDGLLDQAIDISFQSPYAHHGPFSAHQLSFVATLISPWNDPSGALTLNCAKLHLGDWQADNLTFDTTINNATQFWPYQLSCKDGKTGAWELFSNGSWHYADDRADLQVYKFYGTIGRYPFSLQEPVSVSLSPNAKQLSPLSFTVGPGALYALYDTTSEGIQSIVKVSNLPLNLLHEFDDALPIEGTFSLEALVTETLNGVEGRVNGSIHDLSLKRQAIHTPLQIDFNANLTSDVLNCQGHLTGLGPKPFDVEAQLPITLQLVHPKFQFHKDKELSAHLGLDCRVEELFELFIPMANTSFTGNLSLDLNLNGSWIDPRMTGAIIVDEFNYEILDLGVSTTRGKALLQIVGTELIIKQLSAQSKEGGTITGKGKVQLNSKLPFEIQLKLDSMDITPTKYATGSLDGILALSGNIEGAKLSGELQTKELTIQAPEQRPELMHNVTITYINQPKHLPPPTSYKPTSSRWPLNLDLHLRTPSKAYVSGPNWKSEWKGDVFISGMLGQIDLQGDFSILKGEFNFNGKPFQIKRGVINFAGDFEKKTSLYVIASRDLDGIVADVIVKGSLKHPELTFRSNPPLPQREILSWILFNRGSSEITEFEGTQLNESITNLGPNSQKPDILTKIRNKTGLDRIDISRENPGSGEMAVQVGKYISKGLLVSVNRNISAETNRVAIEAHLMKNVKIQAAVGDDSDAQLHLKWKKDY